MKTTIQPLTKGKLIFLFLLTPFSFVFSQSKSDSLTIEKAIASHTVSNPKISPNQTRIAFVVTEPLKGNTPRNSDIWLYDIGTKLLFQVTQSPKADNNPKWSPDGQSLAFLSGRGGETQVYLITLNGGEAFPITKSKTAVKDFEWSPDGKQMAYLTTEPATDEEEKKTKEQDDETVMSEGKPTRLWLLEIATQTATQKSTQNWEISDLKWLPDGQSLALVTRSLPKTEMDVPSFGVFSLKESKFKLIQTPTHPFWSQLKITPDGKSFGFVGARLDGPTTHDLFLQSFSQATAQNVTASKVDLPVTDFKFLPDGQILLTCQKGFYSTLFMMDANQAIKRYPLEQNVGASDLSANGTLAFVSYSSISPTELWLSLSGQSPVQITHFSKPFQAYLLVKPELISYKSFDGKVVEGSFFTPATTQKELPLVVLIHGGPTGAWLDNYQYWAQLFLVRGYAVFCPNVRGSTGYGWEFLTANKNDWGGGDFKDMMAGIDFLIARKGIDKNRIGIAGWSYGGYMTMWAVTQTNRFKAAMAGAGLSDLASEYGTEDGAAYDRWFFGTPYENLANFTKSSPITFIKNAKTPTLIIQGEKDPVDPVGQSQQFYRGLRHYGVPTELVLYPRELHGFREEKHIVDFVRRMLDWFDKYMK